VREWQWHVQQQASLALLLIDVDCFKALNDTRGHVFGDECLRELARLCADVVDDSGGHAARYGGEEFVLLLPHCELRAARRLGTSLCRRVEALAIVHPASLVASHVTVSIGASAARPHARLTAGSLILSADRALYLAKAKGRNRVVARSGAGVG
jgi:diguanylate cyclase (GGDEF)-like protein